MPNSEQYISNPHNYYYFVLPVLSLLFGFTQKIADGHDEHGLNWFPGAAMMFGIGSGLLGAILIQATPVHFATYLSLCFYWIYKLKIDYRNHAIALIIILIGSLSASFPFPIKSVVILFVAYVVFDLVKITYKMHDSIIFKKWIHFLVVPLCFDILNNSFYATISVSLNLAGTIIAKQIFHIK